MFLGETSFTGGPQGIGTSVLNPLSSCICVVIEYNQFLHRRRCNISVFEQLVCLGGLMRTLFSRYDRAGQGICTGSTTASQPIATSRPPSLSPASRNPATALAECECNRAMTWLIKIQYSDLGPVSDMPDMPVVPAPRAAQGCRELWNPSPPPPEDWEAEAAEQKWEYEGIVNEEIDVYGMTRYILSSVLISILNALHRPVTR